MQCSRRVLRDDTKTATLANEHKLDHPFSAIHAMNRDPLHESVVERLAKLTDGVLFEKCVCSLLRGDWPNLIPAPGGDDAGVDGNWSNENGRGIVCVTLQEDVIGNVTRNLNRHKESGALANQVLVVTSRELSQQRCRNVEKRVDELGFRLAHAPYTRDAIVEMLLRDSRWLQELLGISGKPPALSRRPRSCRKTLGVGLLGRDSELARILNSDEDFLIVGQPGIGKTFLLQEMAKQGRGLFVTCSDEGAIANAIRDQAPTAVFVEDSHLSLEIVRFLKHYREEYRASYRIMGDCWPGHQIEVRNAFGITPSASIVLRPLGNDKIVEIIKECGITGPNAFLHILVEQSMGYPGRTLTLIDACKSRRREDLESVWTGESLADAVLASLSQSAERNAAQILACIALGGESGVNAGFVTEILGLSISDVQIAVTQLSMGGVVLEVPGNRIAVVPRTLRPILVRNHFFNAPANLSWREHVGADGIDFSHAIETIVQAHARGAKISPFELLTLVERADSQSCWRSYAYSCPEHAESVLEKHPDQIQMLASELLASSPAQTIPHLLNMSKGDDRSLSSTSEHPLRVLQDWIHSGDPRAGEATRRRQLTLDVFQDWVEAGHDLDLALRLVPLFTSPQFETIEQDPAFRMNHSMRFGGVSLSDLEAIARLWKSVLELLSDRTFANWHSLIDAVRSWFHPSFGGRGAPEGYFKIREETAVFLLPALAEMAQGRPGVLLAITEIADDFPEVQINAEIDPLFRTMFPERWHVIEEDEFQRLLNAAAAYGESMGNASPADTLQRIQACWEESKVLVSRPSSYTSVLCNAISQNATRQIPWIEAAWNEVVEPHILMPFLYRAVETREALAEEQLRTCLLSGRYCRGAIELALPSSVISDDLRLLAIESCRMAPDVVSTVIYLNSLPEDTLRRLLKHDSKAVVQESIQALWHCRKTRPFPESMKPAWRSAVVLHCNSSHELREILRNDNVLRLDWLRHWISVGSYGSRIFQRKSLMPLSRDLRRVYALTFSIT